MAPPAADTASAKLADIAREGTVREEEEEGADTVVEATSSSNSTCTEEEHYYFRRRGGLCIAHKCFYVHTCV